MYFSDSEIAKCTVTKGDLLVCEGGDIGRAAIWNYEYDICIQNHIHRLRAYIDIETKFFYYIFLLYKGLGYIGGKGIGIQGLSSGALHNILVPVPSVSEQFRITAYFEQIEPIIDKYNATQIALNSLNTDIYVQLRKSILQEAIQGKLVAQNPEEEPASILLQRIQNEKLRLVKEGKLKKKDVVDSIIFKGDDNKYFEKKGKDVVCIDNEIPFEIPASWEWVRLADVVMVNPKNAAPDNSDVAFIPMELIDATYLSSYSFLKRKWRDIKTGFTHFADGDVAFAKITPCFQNRKSMILKDLPNGLGAGTTELKVLRPYRNTISAEYLLFFLESPYFVEEATFKGTANQQRITSGYMETKLFPLPPIKEQVRIAQKIKEAYTQIDSYQVL